MRSSTRVWARFESIGYPKDSETVEGELKQVVALQATWLLNVTMGSKIRITYARTQAELETSKAMLHGESMMAELEKLMEQNESGEL